MKPASAISPGFWFLIGGLLAGWSTQYPLGGVANPGPGLYPLVLGLLLMFLSLVLFAQELKTGWSEGGGAGLAVSGKLAKVGYVIGVLIAAIFLFEWAGYLVTIFFFMFLLALIGGVERWKKGLILSILTVAGVYVVFVVLLKQELPRGFLGW
ncbi:MAG: tripartite tricarboxylate transporter TctB family protein [Thermodesulfobacteriota bacterium]